MCNTCFLVVFWYDKEKHVIQAEGFHCKLCVQLYIYQSVWWERAISSVSSNLGWQIQKRCISFFFSYTQHTQRDTVIQTQFMQFNLTWKLSIGFFFRRESQEDKIAIRSNLFPFLRNKKIKAISLDMWNWVRRKMGWNYCIEFFSLPPLRLYFVLLLVTSPKVCPLFVWVQWGWSKNVNKTVNFDPKEQNRT